jgi:hypothetical protein
MSSVISDTQYIQEVPQSTYFQSAGYTTGIGNSRAKSINQQEFFSTPDQQGI